MNSTSASDYVAGVSGRSHRPSLAPCDRLSFSQFRVLFTRKQGAFTAYNLPQGPKAVGAPCLIER